MKFLGVILAIFFVSLVGGNDECIREGVILCFGILETDVSSEEEECGVVRSSIECLRDLMETSLSNEHEKKFFNGLGNLEKFVKKHCIQETTKGGTIPIYPGTSYSPESSMGYMIDGSSPMPIRSSKCTEEMAEDCLRNLSNLSSKIVHFYETREECRNLTSALNCLRDSGDECLDVYSQHIKDIEKRIWRRCAPDEGDITEDCPELLTEEYGSLFSPGFPGPPPNHTDCWTLIQAREEKIILMVFIFYSKASDNCTNGYVEIYDGENKNSPLLERSCDFTIVISSNNSLLVHFHSEYSYNNIHFLAKYKSIYEKSTSPFWELDEDIAEENECVKVNAAYIHECAYGFYATLYEAFVDMEIPDIVMESTKCNSYGGVASCFVNRTIEKCGKDDGMWSKRKILDLLERDASSCIGTYSLEFFGF